MTNWRTSDEKIKQMQSSGFVDLEYAQTLLTHPMYANDKVQDVITGYDRGDYVAICGYKNNRQHQCDCHTGIT